jgi:hypothetical protein
LWPLGAGNFDFLASGADHRPLAKEHVRSDLGLSRNEAKNQKARLDPPFNRVATTFFKPL